MDTLSVCTYAGPIKSLELPFKEVLLSAIPIADEVVVIDSCPISGALETEVENIMNLFFNDEIDLSKFRQYYIPFPKRLRKNCYVLQRSNAIAQCTKDWVLLLDGDEVLHEKDYEKIKTAMELGNTAYTFKVNHFYRDFNHVKTSDWWYKRRPYLFKNNLGIFDGYRSWMENGQIITEYTSDLTTWDYKPVMDFAKHTSIEIFHYGYVRTADCMLGKYNEMETWFHDDSKSQKPKWEWDMSDTVIFNGTHPNVMNELIEKHKQDNPEFYGV